MTRQQTVKTMAGDVANLFEAVLVAALGQSYKEHSERIRPEFPRAKTAEEKQLDLQWLILLRIDSDVEACLLLPASARRERLKIIGGDVSSFENGYELDGPQRWAWREEQKREARRGRKFMRRIWAETAPKRKQASAPRAPQSSRTRPRERRPTTRRASARAPSREPDPEPEPLDAVGLGRPEATAEEGWIREVDAEVSRFHRRRNRGGWYEFKPPKGRAA
jgi:hypothetical protein